MTSTWKKRVEAATISLPQRGGQGVLVPGGFVLTAAHCIGWYATGGMALGDHTPVEVRPKAGGTFHLEVWAIEPVSDIAVLGEPDDQVFYDDFDAFGSFRETTSPVSVRAANFGRVPVHVLTHRGEWVHAEASELASPKGRALVKATKQIENGTSGGPVVDDLGQLVGVVSFCSEGWDFAGAMPRPHRALPSWLWDRIVDAQKLEPGTS